MNRKFSVALILLGALVAVPASAADWMFGARTGFYADQGDPFFGVEGLTPITGAFTFNPNIEWVFIDGGDLATMNADVIYDFDADGDKFWWVGAGVAGVYENINDTEFDIGANVLGGMGWRYGTWEPYVQVKALLSGATDDFVASAGIRF